MNIALWIVQGVLAAAFVAAGLMKSTQPKAKLAENMEWVEDFSPNTVKLIGISELLAGIGLILPWALDIAPVLTPIAATFLVAMMIAAAITHARRKEFPMIAINVVLGALAAFVAIGRF